MVGYLFNRLLKKSGVIELYIRHVQMLKQMKKK